jgi:hypothetical protein
MGEFIGSIIGVVAVSVFILAMFVRHAQLNKEVEDITLRARRYALKNSSENDNHKRT